MPTNVTYEYAKANEKYLAARTREEKIAALEEMIRTAPKHKGCQVLLADLKSKLAKMKKKTESKKSRLITTIPKEGDAQVCIIGLTQSGKSTLLSRLTNATPDISDHPYTTVRPEVGVAEWKGVRIQLIELPSTFQSAHMNIAQNCNGIIIVIDSRKDDEEQRNEIKNILARFRIDKPQIETTCNEYPDDIIERLWRHLKLIRIYTKEPGKKPEKKALVLKKGSTVKDAAGGIHKDFLKFFKFARVWGRSAKHQGQAVGLDHLLEDGDTLEIHIA